VCSVFASIFWLLLTSRFIIFFFFVVLRVCSFFSLLLFHFPSLMLECKIERKKKKAKEIGFFDFSLNCFFFTHSKSSSFFFCRSCTLSQKEKMCFRCFGKKNGLLNCFFLCAFFFSFFFFFYLQLSIIFAAFSFFYVSVLLRF
jgi:hypothetical protein